jgi:hypothetical protein
MAQRYAYKRAFLNRTKDVKSYSSKDLSQILGFSVPDGAAEGDAPQHAPSRAREPPPPPALEVPAPRWRGPPPVPSVLKGQLVHMFTAGGFLNNDAK